MPVLSVNYTEPRIVVSAHEQMVDKDDFAGIIDTFFDNGDGPHDECCHYLYGTCEQIASFSISTYDDRTGATYVHFYCPKHFLLEMHCVIDTVTTDLWFSKLPSQHQRQSMFATYFSSAQRVRD